MLRNSVRNLLSRPATRRYPDEQPELPENLRGHVEFDMAKCIFCLMCSKRCPTEAIETDKDAKEHRINRNTCIACGTCVENCPTDAIIMKSQYLPPDYTPVIDVYTAEHTDHHYTIASLPSFVREPGEVEEVAEEEWPPKGEPLPEAGEPKPYHAVALETMASDIMVRKVIFVKEDTKIREAAKLMLDNDISGMPVVDAQGRVVGIVTERDLTKGTSAKGRHGLWAKLMPHLDREVDEDELHLALDAPVSTVMTSPVITAEEDATCSDMARLMNEQKINRIPIVGRDDRLKGIVSRADLIKVLTEPPP
jgi:CBS domain-containing protein